MSHGKRSNYFHDEKLIPRIKQYMDSNKQKCLDIDDTVEYLQRRYSDYKRKKKYVLMKSVRKAYDSLTRSGLSEDNLTRLENNFLSRKIHQNKNGLDISPSESSDNEDSNAVNDMVSDCYRKNSSSAFAQTPSQLQKNKSFNNPDPTPEKNLELWNASKEDSNKQLNDATPLEKNRKRKTTNRSDASFVKKTKSNIRATTSTSSFADVGGCDDHLNEICQLMLHMTHPEIYEHLGVLPPRGLLLHGPPGCGKTLLANAIAGELELPFLKLSGPEIVKGVSGESEEVLRELFELATNLSPSIVFIDEIDSVTPKREVASKDMERRIVAQLLACLDDLNGKMSRVMVIGATNRADSVDPALRRAGRFDREICLGIPNEDARRKILHVLSRDLCLSSDVDYDKLAYKTPGYVGADLMALTREAAINAVSRQLKKLEESQDPNEDFFRGMEVDSNDQSSRRSSVNVIKWIKELPTLTQEQLRDVSIGMQDFEASLCLVQPSAKREGFATVPDVTWNDVGALHDIREELKLSILAPVQYRAEFETLGLIKPPGILLAGPPGCGKTLLAKAIANESGINFISVKGPELLNMYVGESERAVRQVFQRAQNSCPCVIFFDELDALCPRRTDAAQGGSSVRVVNQMLTEMDGLTERRQVFLMAATNRPDIIDPAILRPGRFDKILYVGFPSVSDRLDILKTLTKGGCKPPICRKDMDDGLLMSLSESCESFTGADLAAVVREASVVAMKAHMAHSSPPSASSTSRLTSVELNKDHFDKALEKVKPSVSHSERQRFRQLEIQLTKR